MLYPIESISPDDPSNSAVDRSELSGNANGQRDLVHSCEPNGSHPFAHSPALNPAQHVASAATNIDDVQWMPSARCPHNLLQPLKRGTICERNAIDLGEIVKALAKIRIRARFVHPFGELGRAGGSRRTPSAALFFVVSRRADSKDMEFHRLRSKSRPE